MSKNVIRLAELLQADTLTAAERREGVNLAQAMFGSQSLAQLDSVRVALRRKRISGSSDPAGLTAPGRHVVIGAGKDTPTPTSADEAEELGELAAGEFKLGDDLYAEKHDKADRPFYTLNGKRIKASDYQAAKLEAEGAAEDEDESEES